MQQNMLTSPELLLLADANRAEFTREHARWLPPTAVEEHSDLLLSAAGTSFPAGPWNCLMGLGPHPADGSALRLAKQFFFAKRRGFTVYARAHLDRALCEACEHHGLTLAGDTPGMALLARAGAPELAPGIALRRVQSADDARAFVEIQARAYETMQVPPAVTRKLLSQHERWLSPYCTTHLLLDHERPVAGGMLLYSHGIAGVYWIGTIPEARGRGHAETLTRGISEEAFARGARAVVLQASAQGEPIYRRIGYREITRYPWYLVLLPK